MSNITHFIKHNDVITYFQDIIKDLITDSNDSDEIKQVSADMINGAMVFCEAFGIISDEESEKLRS